jgi:hypothetical protein
MNQGDQTVANAKTSPAAKPAGKTFNNPFDMFQTDKSKEQEGIVLNYSDVFWIQITRAGGSNDHYKRILTEKLKPFRRAIQTETIDEAASARLMREAVAEGIVLNWGTGRFPNGAGSIPSSPKSSFAGEPIPFSAENVAKVFEELPDLFNDVYEQANKVSLFRATETEGDAGN